MTTGARRAAYRLGLRAETVAAWYLRLKGYRVVAIRHRTRMGEIDLVAVRRRLVIFVEVKARATEAAGLEAVTARSRIRIARAASAYIQRHRSLGGHDRRFDIIVVRPWRLPHHLRHAFDDPTA